VCYNGSMTDFNFGLFAFFIAAMAMVLILGITDAWDTSLLHDIARSSWGHATDVARSSWGKSA
jgi:hypothetical protein